MTPRIKRSVGYCTAKECEDYMKGIFLLNHGDTFYCPRCKHLGFVEPESGRSKGSLGIYKEVRIEYDYDPLQKKYRGLAIVRDESLWGECNVFYFQSPLIRTEKRALKVAEATLSNLNIQDRPLLPGELPYATEMVMSFDVSREQFAKEIGKLETRLENEAFNRVRKAQKTTKATAAEINL